MHEPEIGFGCKLVACRCGGSAHRQSNGRGQRDSVYGECIGGAIIACKLMKPIGDFAMVRKLGVFMGSLFLIGGILAFVPGVTKNNMYFGVFMVNTPHNIMHIASGTIFLIASKSGARQPVCRSNFLESSIRYLRL